MADPNQVIVHNLQAPGLLDLKIGQPDLEALFKDATPIEMPTLPGEPPKHKSQHELQAVLGAGSPSSLPPGIGISAEPGMNGHGPTDFNPAPLSLFPFLPIGRLYVQHGLGQAAVRTYGTAWSCGGAAVMTAGHCVFTPALGWPTQVYFVPRFAPGQPLGPFLTAVQVASVAGWINGNHATDQVYQFDFAAIHFPVSVEQQLGKLGWRTNPSPRCTALGYPGDNDPGSAALRGSTGATFSTGINGAYNDLPPGCSGGPWVSWASNPPIAIGLNSYRQGQGDVAFSPPFGTAFQNLVSLW